MDDKTRMICWAIRHDSHGIYIGTPVWLPEGDEPDTKANWIRLPWLDQPQSEQGG